MYCNPNINRHVAEPKKWSGRGQVGLVVVSPLFCLVSALCRVFLCLKWARWRWRWRGRSQKSVFSFLRQLTTWHYPHLLLRAVLRRGCCRRRPAGRAVIDRYLLAAGPTAANSQQRVCGGQMGQTNGRTDGRTPDSCIDPAPHTMR